MNVEYDAPPFMGWTASTHQIFANIEKDLPFFYIILS